MPSAADLFSSVTARAIQDITFRSQVTPDFSYQPTHTPPGPPGPQGPPGPPAPPEPAAPRNVLMELVKPEVTIQSVAGPMTFAPYGTPTRNYVPLFYVFTGLAVYGAYHLAKWVVWR